jgi:hypothetical protein
MHAGCRIPCRDWQGRLTLVVIQQPFASLGIRHDPGADNVPQPKALAPLASALVGLFDTIAGTLRWIS